MKESFFSKPEGNAVASMVYTFVKINHTENFKSMHFTVCKLYLKLKISMYEIEIPDFNTFQ